MKYWNNLMFYLGFKYKFEYVGVTDVFSRSFKEGCKAFLRMRVVEPLCKPRWVKENKKYLFLGATKNKRLYKFFMRLLN